MFCKNGSLKGVHSAICELSKDLLLQMEEQTRPVGEEFYKLIKSVVF